MHASNERQLEAARSRYPDCRGVIAFDAQCDERGSEGWAFRLVKVSVDDIPSSIEDGCGDVSCGVTMTVALVSREADGSLASAPAGIERVGLPSNESLVLRLVDLNGDGKREALVRQQGSCNAPTGDNRSVFGRVGGALVDVLPFAHAQIGDVEDKDGDGIVDVSTSGPYDIVVHPLGPEYPLRDMFLAHGRRDGFPVLDDAVSRESLADTCRAWPRALPAALKKADRFEIFTAIVCARARGASAAEVQAALRAACQRVDDVWTSEVWFTLESRRCCWSGLYDVAAETPPVHLE